MAVGAAAHTTTGLNIPPAPPSGRVNDDRLLSPAEDTEERIETAAGQGLLGGPMMWGFIALAVVIVLIYALT